MGKLSSVNELHIKFQNLSINLLSCKVKTRWTYTLLPYFRIQGELSSTEYWLCIEDGILWPIKRWKWRIYNRKQWTERQGLTEIFASKGTVFQTMFFFLFFFSPQILFVRKTANLVFGMPTREILSQNQYFC